MDCRGCHHIIFHFGADLAEHLRLVGFYPFSECIERIVLLVVEDVFQDLEQPGVRLAFNFVQSSSHCFEVDSVVFIEDFVRVRSVTD